MDSYTIKTLLSGTVSSLVVCSLFPNLPFPMLFLPWGERKRREKKTGKEEMKEKKRKEERRREMRREEKNTNLKD